MLFEFMGYLLSRKRVEQKNFWYSLPTKVRFSNRNLRILRIANLKNKSFFLSQNVVKIKANSVWSITDVVEFSTKRNFCYSLPTKNLGTI